MKYSIEVGVPAVSGFTMAVREFEALMREAMVHGGLSHDEAFWYVSTIRKEGK
jgi:hypothetical protein